MCQWSINICKRTPSLKVTNNLCFFNAAGSINVSNILTGKCLAKIRASNGFPMVKECSCSDDNCSSSACNSGKQKHSSRIRSTVAEALEDITALFYDEERNEIYTGNRHGLVHVWSNWCIVEFILVSCFLISIDPWVAVIVLSWCKNLWESCTH